MGKLDGKVALITGAGSGIGRATALILAKEGAKVVVADHVPTAGQETTAIVREAGGEAIFVEVDVSKSADVERMVGSVVDAHGRVDILHNNAGIGGRGAFTAKLTEHDWDSVLEVNLKGVFLCSKYAIPVMLNSGGGVIINTASTAGILGQPGAAAYCASKAGIIALTKTMALEYAKDNIRVNCVCPAGIQTPMTQHIVPSDVAAREGFMQTRPFGRMGRPDEVARAVLYLASDDSSFVSGASLVVDGGWSAGIPLPRPRTK